MVSSTNQFAKRKNAYVRYSYTIEKVSTKEILPVEERRENIVAKYSSYTISSGAPPLGTVHDFRILNSKVLLTVHSTIFEA